MTGRWPEGTVGRALDDAAAALADAAIETARLDARILMAHSLNCDQAWLMGHADDPLAAVAAARFVELIRRRLTREPVAYLVGAREFWSLGFRVTPDTLVPRADSETLVEAALAILRTSTTPRLLDLGTGTGCLLLSILHDCPAARGVGLERSPDAADVARDNAGRLGLDDRAEFVVGSWNDDTVMAGLGAFDLIVSNPPYIRTAEMIGLDPDVRDFEPAGALVAGEDGLDAYREIVPRLPALLRPGGHFVGEFGVDHAEPIVGLLTRQGMREVEIRRDTGGRARCVVARLGA